MHAAEEILDELREEIDRFNDWLYLNINNARYRTAFCTSLSAYQEAFNNFYNAMDQLEERLAVNRFLFGDYITDSDIRFFVTLARFDTAYYRDLGPIKKRGTTRKVYTIGFFDSWTLLYSCWTGHPAHRHYCSTINSYTVTESYTSFARYTGERNP